MGFHYVIVNRDNVLGLRAGHIIDKNFGCDICCSGYVISYC